MTDDEKKLVRELIEAAAPFADPDSILDSSRLESAIEEASTLVYPRRMAASELREKG